MSTYQYLSCSTLKITSRANSFHNFVQEEQAGYDAQLQRLEETLKAREADHAELLLLSYDAFSAKETAQAELHRFEQGVMEERNQRDREVQEKKGSLS